VHVLSYVDSFSSKKPLLILDRDSTIIIDKGYTWKVSDLEFLPGALTSLRFATENQVSVALATNQSGLGYGYFSFDDYIKFSNLLVKEVAKNGGSISFIATCPHLPDNDCACRKPKPGLVQGILDKFKTPKCQTLLLGNADTDVQAGRNAGVKSAIAVGASIEIQVHDWLKQIDNH